MAQEVAQPEEWREGRRLRAWALTEKGWSQQAIAEALGVKAGAVSQWMRRGREGGIEALKRRIAPGPTPKLTAELAASRQMIERQVEQFVTQAERLGRLQTEGFCSPRCQGRPQRAVGAPGGHEAAVSDWSD